MAVSTEEKKGSTIMWRRVIIPALLAAAVVGTASAGLAGRTPAAPERAAYAAGQQSGIVVNGEGTVGVVPDLAVLHLGVEARAKSVAEAREQAAQAMGTLLDRLAQLGIQPADIRTLSVSISPDYVPASPPPGPANTGPGVEGYRAANTLEVKVRQIASLSQVIDGAVNAAGDAVRFYGMGLDVQDRSAALRRARDLAMQDARAKAEHLAALSGVPLGRPVAIVDYSSSRPVPFGGSFGPVAPAAGGKDTPLALGQTEVALNLQVTFAAE